MSNSPRPFVARVAEKTVLNEKFLLLRLEIVTPHDFSFMAGQYVLIDVPGSLQKKSYSIASAPDVGHSIDLLIDISPQGAGTQYLQNLEAGSTITGLAPIGRFVLAEPLEEALTFIATGSGLAPLKSMIDELLIYKGNKRPMILYWGLRYPQDQFWYNELALLSEQHPNFVFHPVLSRPPAEWKLCRGHVTDCLRVHALLERSGYYLCGSQDMVTEASAVLAGRGVASSAIHYEKYY